MFDLFRWLFSADHFMPHGHCYLWQPATLWLNVASDAMIAMAYFAIPGALYYYVRQRKDEIPYAWVPMMFAAFILLCGGTHAMDVLTVWNPVYRVAGVLKLLTGLVSVATLLSIIWIMPRAILLQTPSQLQAQVASRTAELAAVNSQLRAEIARRDAAEHQLRLADRRKDEFLATLAHELRNPLAPIRNSIRLLDGPGTDDGKRQWASSVIARQVKRMALLLDDLLDVSRITRGRLELKRELVELSVLVESAVETASPLIEEKRHTLTVDLPQELITVDVDPLRISQSIANLLSNSAKYTHPGGHINLSVARQDSTLVIRVSDTGIGFSPSAVADMFEMFAQIAPETYNTEAGLGIGLALVKGLIALHGGSIEAASDGVGRGAVFTITLPRCVVSKAPPALVPATRSVSPLAGESCKVLVVDDNRDSADSLGMILESDGYAVTVAYAGADALELAEREHPTIIVLDIGMPGLTGYETAERIRLSPWGRDAFLVAMTGWGQEADKQRAKQAGFDVHLTKPIDAEQLKELMQAFRGGTRIY